MTWQKTTSREHAAPSVRCGTCNEAMPADYWTKIGSPPSPVHCEGSTLSWSAHTLPNPHHGRRAYACWRCHGSLGCDQCAGPVTEVLCKRCVAWATPEALAEHGPMLNTPIMVAKRGGRHGPVLAAYPPAFRAAYQRAVGFEEHAVGGPELREQIQQVSETLGDWWDR